MNKKKETISRHVDNLATELLDVSKYLLNHPETAYQEFESCAYLSQILDTHGFNVETGVGGVETAFFARPDNAEPKRPCIAFIAEYDALPKIGHACGHNMIASASIGAAVALKKIMKDDAGSIVVVGTPAEEGGGGKVLLMNAGVFEAVDAVLMFHPSQSTLVGKGMLGRIKFKMAFHGKTAHAANSPDKGINALDALILAYTGINSLRQHLRPDAKIHGIITHGGDAPNIIPDYAEAMFYVRGGTIAYRDEVFDKVVQCAESAAAAMGARVDISVEGPKLDPMHRNFSFEDAFQANMDLMGIPVDEDSGRMGSSDMGNLSHLVPAIHPWLSITGSDIPGHTVEFRDATFSDKGKDALLKAAKLLAMTAYDYLSSPDLRDRISQDFNKG